MATTAPGSWLHGAIGIEPGRAPEYLCSRDDCEGADLLLLVDAGAILASLSLSMVLPLIGIPLFVAALLFIGRAELPFRDAERKARARIRRGECVVCGQKLIDGACPTRCQ